MAEGIWYDRSITEVRERKKIIEHPRPLRRTSGPGSPRILLDYWFILHRERIMAEFIEVPIEREDGSKGLHYINISAISYIDLCAEHEGKRQSLTVYLNSGYWFTLSGPKADQLLNLVRGRECMHFKAGAGDN